MKLEISGNNFLKNNKNSNPNKYYCNMKFYSFYGEKKCIVFLFLTLFLFTGKTLYSQRLFQFYYNIMNPIMLDAHAYNGHSTGFNILNKKFGYELEYARTGKRFESKYLYINPQFKIKLSAKEKSQVSTYNYFTIGFHHFTVTKDWTYYGRGENTQKPYWDTLETAKTYNEYLFKTKMKTTCLQVGIENVKERHLRGVAFPISPIVNPFGMIIGWITTGKGEPYKLDFTRTLRFSIFAAPPGFIKLEKRGYEPLGGSYLKDQLPNENVVIEPLMKNLIGCRLGILWTSLKSVGSSFGLEITMVPGIYNIPGVYGREFPDDNIYIRANFGISLGNSSKN
ncbi:MAG: hypothetical protein HUU47_06760 [Bacteroidetes bacterium]|nr:hypothetical protein [Bacteroidota bacterium]